VANLKPFDRKALRDKATGVAQKSGQLELPLFHSEIHVENQSIGYWVNPDNFPKMFTTLPMMLKISITLFSFRLEFFI
jgi:hypothetical protein